MCSAQTSKSNYHFHGGSGFYVSEIFVLTSHIQKQLPYSWLLGFLCFKSIPHHFCGNAGYYSHKEGELIGVNHFWGLFGALGFGLGLSLGLVNCKMCAG